MKESHQKLTGQDRLKLMDEIFKRGSVEQQQKLLWKLTDVRKGISPKFYSRKTRTGIRYPGDGGPGPEIDSDHESVEGDIGDGLIEMDMLRIKRGKDPDKVRAYYATQRARRALMEPQLPEGADYPRLNRGYANLKQLGEALGKTWRPRPSFQIVRDLLLRIQAGTETGSSLLTLDTEFVSFSRRLLEVAVGEVHSGKVLIDLRVDHQCSPEELLKRPDGRPLNNQERNIGLKSITRTYGSAGPAQCSGKMTATEIAEALKSAGINQKSVILVWHINYFDLTLLRELLESNGHADVLPPQANCIPMIPQFRLGLPGRDRSGRLFVASKLEILFPMLFPGHHLVGKNHRAGADIEMLRLMSLLLVQLQNPPEKRELKEFPVATQRYIESGEAAYTLLEKWLGVSGLEEFENARGEGDNTASRDEDDCIMNEDEDDWDDVDADRDEDDGVVDEDEDDWDDLDTDRDDEGAVDEDKDDGV